MLRGAEYRNRAATAFPVFPRVRLGMCVQPYTHKHTYSMGVFMCRAAQTDVVRIKMNSTSGLFLFPFPADSNICSNICY